MALRLEQVNGKNPKRGKKEAKSAEAKPKAPRKKATAPAPEVSISIKSEETPVTAASAAPKIATPTPTPPRRPQLRPWSQTGLAKNGQSRKDRLGRDHHMNEEWMSLHEAPLFWIDLSPESKLAAVQEKLMELERRALALARAPKEMAARARTRLKAIFR